MRSISQGEFVIVSLRALIKTLLKGIQLLAMDDTVPGDDSADYFCRLNSPG